MSTRAQLKEDETRLTLEPAWDFEGWPGDHIRVLARTWNSSFDAQIMLPLELVPELITALQRLSFRMEDDAVKRAALDAFDEAGVLQERARTLSKMAQAVEITISTEGTA